MKKVLSTVVGYILVCAVIICSLWVFVEIEDNWDEHTWEVIEITLNTSPDGEYEPLDTLWEVACYYCPSDVDEHQYIDMVEKLNNKSHSEMKRYENIKIYVAWAENN
jgi:hypothetical protein